MEDISEKEENLQMDSLKPVELRGQLKTIRHTGRREVTLTFTLDELQSDLGGLMDYLELPVVVHIESGEFTEELG